MKVQWLFLDPPLINAVTFAVVAGSLRKSFVDGEWPGLSFEPMKNQMWKIIRSTIPPAARKWNKIFKIFVSF